MLQMGDACSIAPWPPGGEAVAGFKRGDSNGSRNGEVGGSDSGRCRRGVRDVDADSDGDGPESGNDG